MLSFRCHADVTFAHATPLIAYYYSAPLRCFAAHSRYGAAADALLHAAAAIASRLLRSAALLRAQRAARRGATARTIILRCRYAARAQPAHCYGFMRADERFCHIHILLFMLRYRAMLLLRAFAAAAMLRRAQRAPEAKMRKDRLILFRIHAASDMPRMRAASPCAAPYMPRCITRH